MPSFAKLLLHGNVKHAAVLDIKHFHEISYLCKTKGKRESKYTKIGGLPTLKVHLYYSKLLANCTVVEKYFHTLLKLY